MTPKPWQTVEWKRKREIFLIDKTCYKCGSSDNLIIHHLKALPPYFEHYKYISNQILTDVMGRGEFQPSEYHNCCPICGFRSIYARKTVKPKYKCQKCNSFFEEPKRVLGNRLSKEDLAKFSAKYKEKIKEIVKLQRDNFFKNEYLEFKDCIVLCNKCHLLGHKGMDICPICKKNAKKIGYDKCWNCFISTPEGQKVKKEKEEYDAWEKIETERDDAFMEMVDECYALVAEGKQKEADELEREFHRKYSSRKGDDD